MYDNSTVIAANVLTWERGCGRGMGRGDGDEFETDSSWANAVLRFPS